ncbi:RGG repeats nuclear RNA binding protein A-like [Phoenix dactylifera]|uniref:RGG repeats nuclear RNA binding protein A-like n=1 Tax=Phoenix dactylifera TaxID=42345 RepID=A0A8B9AHF6_PHODC|nr:RGG repeats nuclear RNA binding protein A-like [Phoenix dactylifera]
MATANPFDLLGDDDNDDPSQLIAVQQQKIAAKKPASAAAPPAAVKLPSKPAPPALAVREARSNAATARGGAVRGRGRRGGWTGPNRGFGNGDANGFTGGYGGSSIGDEGDAAKPFERERGGHASQRQPYRGGRRGGYSNGDAGDDSERPPRKGYERHSGTGRGYEMKREGSGRGNWGTPTDDMLTQATDDNGNIDEKLASPEKQPLQEDGPLSEASKDNKEGEANELEEKELEDKEMTLEEYEKIKEEKRKALLASKPEERKVELDKDFESMQLLSLKKGNDDVFMKLGTDKDSGKKRDNADREERVKKSFSITEFLKPAEGERYYSPGGRGFGRGRGRGRGDRRPFGDGFGSGVTVNATAPSIEDPGQFPTLGGK